MTFHEPSMAAYQAKSIRENECHVCWGHKRIAVNSETGTTRLCEHCKGTGEATDEDRERLAVHDEGICLVCKLPYVKGEEENPGTKCDSSGTNDCLDHLRQYVLKLEAELAKFIS